MATYTYPVNYLTTVGKVRHLIADTDTSEAEETARYSDEVITEMYNTLGLSDYYQTAIVLLEGDAASVALTASILKLGPFGMNRKAVADAIEARISALKGRAICLPVTTEVDIQFTLDNGSDLGSMHNW